MCQGQDIFGDIEQQAELNIYLIHKIQSNKINVSPGDKLHTGEMLMVPSYLRTYFVVLK